VSSGNTATFYIEGNLSYRHGTGIRPFEFDPEPNGAGTRATYYVNNNTGVAVGSQSVMRFSPRSGANTAEARVKNNLFITDGTAISQEQTITIYDAGNNITLTHAQAASAGLTVANLFRPQNSSVSTINAGTDVSAYRYSLTDIVGTSVPQGSAFDVGYFEWVEAQGGAGVGNAVQSVTGPGRMRTR
jgi:hypothetical protein